MGNWIVKNLRYIADCVLEVFSGDDGSCILCGEYCGEDGEEKNPPDIEHDDVDNLKNTDSQKKPFWNAINAIGSNLVPDLQLCSRCMSNIKLCMDHIDLNMANRSFRCYSAAYYSGAMKELVLRLKYKSDFRAGECIAYYMKEVIAREKPDFDIIACVPSGHSAYKKRGYNQSHVLAVNLSRLLDVPASSPLVKIKETQDQIGLNEASRWHNMEGSFKVKDSRVVENKRILLIDDVITTGATAFCSACALSDAGAAKVTILTAAKSRL